MVNQGFIQPFCDLLTIRDSQIVQVILDGLNNVLKMAGPRTSQICALIEECGGKFFYCFAILLKNLLFIISIYFYFLRVLNHISKYYTIPYIAKMEIQ